MLGGQLGDLTLPRIRLALHGPMHVAAESPKFVAQVTEPQDLVNAG